MIGLAELTSDAYLHIGLPRFQSPDDAIASMDTAGISFALACPFETCPDLHSVHQAQLRAPHRFLAVGLAIGGDRKAITKSIRAQFDAGFRGLRLSTELLLESPWILDLIGESHGFALVCGHSALEPNARDLLRYLDNYEDGLVLAGHFAGPRETGVFSTSAETAELFAHERMAVILSRHGLFDPELLEKWTRELIARVGWHRLLWGSEAPVLYWRDESLASAMSWIDRFAPTEIERAQFLGGNLHRLVQSRPQRPTSSLDLDFDPMDFRIVRPSHMWPNGLHIDDALGGRLVHEWLAWGGGERGTLGEFAAELLDRGMRQS
jgi:hypothetical protein